MKEKTSLWQKKLNFPNLSIQVVQPKLDQVLNTYDECVKRGKYDPFNEVFDITKKIANGCAVKTEGYTSSDRMQRTGWVNWEASEFQNYPSIQKKKNSHGTNFINSNNNVNFRIRD